MGVQALEENSLAPKQTNAVALADLNADGHLDILFGNGSNQANQLVLNNGNTNTPFDQNSNFTNITDETDQTFAIASVWPSCSVGASAHF